jgi:hypothetical protein
MAPHIDRRVAHSQANIIDRRLTIAKRAGCHFRQSYVAVLDVQPGVSKT